MTNAFLWSNTSNLLSILIILISLNCHTYILLIAQGQRKVWRDYSQPHVSIFTSPRQVKIQASKWNVIPILYKCNKLFYRINIFLKQNFFLAFLTFSSSLLISGGTLHIMLFSWITRSYVMCLFQLLVYNQCSGQMEFHPWTYCISNFK